LYLSSYILCIVFYPVNSSITRHQLEFPEKVTRSTIDRMRKTADEVTGSPSRPLSVAQSIPDVTSFLLFCPSHSSVFNSSVSLSLFLNLPVLSLFVSSFSLSFLPFFSSLFPHLISGGHLRLLSRRETPTGCRSSRRSHLDHPCLPSEASPSQSTAASPRCRIPYLLSARVACYRRNDLSSQYSFEDAAASGIFKKDR
jgi:hypothetical protein